MRTKNFLKHLFMGALLLTTGEVVGQSTTPGNVAGGVNDFLGWDNTFPANNFPLQVRHDLNQPIDWYTNALQRMRLYPNIAPAISTYAAVPRDGSLLLSNLPVTFTSPAVPFSRLHLADVGASSNLDVIVSQFGWRPWMRNGVTFSGNSDQGYVGQKYGTNGQGGQLTNMSDMVLHWSNDGEGENGPDRLRFLFTGTPNAAASGARSDEGLEGMRLFPLDDNNINVGIGDYFAGNLADPGVTEPTERLDVLTGRVRVRELPTDPQAPTLEKFLVVDDVDPLTGEFGVVKWRNLPVSTSSNCDWTLSPGAFKMATAYLGGGTNGSCPDRRWMVGIGISPPLFKLDIDHSEADGGTRGGMRIKYLANSTSISTFGTHVAVEPTMSGSHIQNPTGVFVSVKGPSAYAVGVGSVVTMDYASGALSTATGVSGRVNANTGTVGSTYGGVGDVALNGATVLSGSPGFGAFGLYGNSSGGGTITNNHGVYGRSHLTSGTANYAYGVKGTSSTQNTLSAGAVGNSYGVYGLSSGPATPVTMTNSHGVYGRGVNGTNNYSIYGSLPTGGAINWSGFFEGAISAAGFAFPSDQSLKSDIQRPREPNGAAPAVATQVVFIQAIGVPSNGLARRAALRLYRARGAGGFPAVRNPFTPA